MRSDNPAVYECPKGSGGLHSWRMIGKTATCQNCKIVLSEADTADCFAMFDPPIGDGISQVSKFKRRFPPATNWRNE